MNPSIVCFGETLWDMLPTGKMPGGAPMNVAIHLKYNGLSPVLISRVGSDDLGSALLDFIRRKGLTTDWVQVGVTHLTGVVKANVTNKTEVVYKIVKPVAWDYIQYDEQAAERVKHGDVFVYGSLAARSKTTRDTLLKYLKLARTPVFDVNFRPPYYTPKRTEQLLNYARIVKMNHHELAEILSWHNYDQSGDEKVNMAYVKNTYDLDMVIVTRGENGAAVLTSGGYFEHPGFPVEVEDTIGSGDAFLATFLSNHFIGQSTDECLKKACKMGSLVAGSKGATPYFNLSKFL